MKRGSSKQTAAEMGFEKEVKPNANASGADGLPSDAAIFLQSLHDSETIERVRATIHNAHVFKLPPKQSASVGWRGADWKEKVWQGTVKVVERGDLTAVLLVDKSKGSIFAVCPVKEGAVDRCVDSSRYFVLRIENANGRHMFIGVAFNERNDAFDFNTSLEDSRREREQEKNPVKVETGPPKDYSIKEGEKIKVSIPKITPLFGEVNEPGQKNKKPPTSSSGKSFLRPSSRDTPKRDGDMPSRKDGEPTKAVKRPSSTGAATATTPDESLGSFFNATSTDPFPAESFGGDNFFANEQFDNESASSNPFFKEGGNKKDMFDPRNYKTESGR